MIGQQTVTFVTRTQKKDADGNPVYDDLGNVVYDETEATDDGWLFAPAGFTELVQSQDTVISNPSLYKLGATSTPSAVDAVIVDGVTYEVDGQPQLWPLGVVIRLENATG